LGSPLYDATIKVTLAGDHSNHLYKPKTLLSSRWTCLSLVWSL